jgi:AraC-like DNA-binding protein
MNSSDRSERLPERERRFAAACRCCSRNVWRNSSKSTRGGHFVGHSRRTRRSSLYHFAHAFRQSFGIPAHRYHIARRMDRARNLLRRSAFSVTQIGSQIGFRETSSFTRAYRKFAGVTPSDIGDTVKTSLTSSDTRGGKSFVTSSWILNTGDVLSYNR